MFLKISVYWKKYYEKKNETFDDFDMDMIITWSQYKAKKKKTTWHDKVTGDHDVARSP